MQLEHPTRVQATVAVVRYASLARQRLGVASTYLCERLEVGQQLLVYISRNPDFRWAWVGLVAWVVKGASHVSCIHAWARARLLRGSTKGHQQPWWRSARTAAGCRGSRVNPKPLRPVSRLRAAATAPCLP